MRRPGAARERRRAAQPCPRAGRSFHQAVPPAVDRAVPVQPRRLAEHRRADRAGPLAGLRRPGGQGLGRQRGVAGHAAARAAVRAAGRGAGGPAGPPDDDDRRRRDPRPAVPVHPPVPAPDLDLRRQVPGRRGQPVLEPGHRRVHPEPGAQGQAGAGQPAQPAHHLRHRAARGRPVQRARPGQRGDQPGHAAVPRPATWTWPCTSTPPRTSSPRSPSTSSARSPSGTPAGRSPCRRRPGPSGRAGGSSGRPRWCAAW